MRGQFPEVKVNIWVIFEANVETVITDNEVCVFKYTLGSQFVSQRQDASWMIS